MKNGDLSVMSISILMLGHSPILSLRLNASLYLYNKSLTYVFSILDKYELSKFMYLSKISLSVMYFLSSVSSNQGYFPSELSSSFLLRFTNILYWLHTSSASLKCVMFAQMFLKYFLLYFVET